MEMDGLGIVAVIVLFLVVLVVAGGARRSVRMPSVPRPQRHHPPLLVEDTDSDDIADEDAPSRDDD